MTVINNRVRDNISVWKALLLIFIPTTLLTLIYIIVSQLLHSNFPTLLIFFVLALVILLPIEVGVILFASKKEFGSYSLKSAFIYHQKLSWWKIVLYGSLLWGFAGIMSVTFAPLENMLFASISNKLTNIIPPYFEWFNKDYLKQFSKDILILTCVVFFILNVIILPIVEELFFRGYLTAKISRFGKFAPFIMTVLFSLYHFWLPFNNLFRIIVFYPAAYFAWKKNNIYISIVFHCLSNLITAISFIVLISSIL